MTNFCVSYELHQPDDGREASLLAALEVFEDRCHALPSLWLICTSWTTDQIRSYLGAYLGPEDSLLVEPLPVARGWSGWMDVAVKDWLLRHLGPSSGYGSAARSRSSKPTGGKLAPSGVSPGGSVECRVRTVRCRPQPCAKRSTGFG